MKKSQIQMGETIAVLVVFFMLLFFGYVFYARIEQTSAQRQYEEDIALKSIRIAQIASNMPELQCAKRDIRTPNCYDLLKIKGFAEDIDKNDYVGLLGVSKVYIRDVYKPDLAFYTGVGVTLTDVDGDTNNEEIELYNQAPAALEGQYTKAKATNTPISIENPVSKENAFAVLVVVVYG